MAALPQTGLSRLVSLRNLVSDVVAVLGMGGGVAVAVDCGVKNVFVPVACVVQEVFALCFHRSLSSVWLSGVARGLLGGVPPTSSASSSFSRLDCALVRAVDAERLERAQLAVARAVLVFRTAPGLLQSLAVLPLQSPHHVARQRRLHGLDTLPARFLSPEDVDDFRVSVAPAPADAHVRLDAFDLGVVHLAEGAAAVEEEAATVFAEVAGLGLLQFVQLLLHTSQLLLLPLAADLGVVLALAGHARDLLHGGRVAVVGCGGAGRCCGYCGAGRVADVGLWWSWPRCCCGCGGAGRAAIVVVVELVAFVVVVELVAVVVCGGAGRVAVVVRGGAGLVAVVVRGGAGRVAVVVRGGAGLVAVVAVVEVVVVVVVVELASSLLWLWWRWSLL